MTDDANRPDFVEAFQDLYLESELKHETVRRILSAHHVTTMLELREGGDMCEIELSQMHPIYIGLEGMWFTLDLDWLIYASHENSITIGGKWLLPAVQAAWPDWESRIWTTPFYERA